MVVGVVQEVFRALAGDLNHSRSVSQSSSSLVFFLSLLLSYLLTHGGLLPSARIYQQFARWKRQVLVGADFQ